MSRASSCIDDLVSNEFTFSSEKFAAIIGKSPSKGARSPLLWNAAFAAHNVDASMVALDVETRNLESLLSRLDADERFIGGAVAVPYKEAIARYLGNNLTLEARDIGSVNCLFRNQGQLYGANTDGIGAEIALTKRFGPLEGAKVLLLGPGGAGKAVAASVCRAVRPHGVLTIAGRTIAVHDFARRIGARSIDWGDLASEICSADLLVNCTSLGSQTDPNTSPLEFDVLAKMPSNGNVFDIIYQPSPTVLLKFADCLNLAWMDGRAMNLEQAVSGYGYAALEPRGIAVTREAMWNCLSAS